MVKNNPGKEPLIKMQVHTVSEVLEKYAHLKCGCHDEQVTVVRGVVDEFRSKRNSNPILFRVRDRWDGGETPTLLVRYLDPDDGVTVPRTARAPDRSSVFRNLIPSDDVEIRGVVRRSKRRTVLEATSITLFGNLNPPRSLVLTPDLTINSLDKIIYRDRMFSIRTMGALPGSISLGTRLGTFFIHNMGGGVIAVLVPENKYEPQYSRGYTVMVRLDFQKVVDLLI